MIVLGYECACRFSRNEPDDKYTNRMPVPGRHAELDVHSDREDEIRRVMYVIVTAIL